MKTKEKGTKVPTVPTAEAILLALHRLPTTIPVDTRQTTSPLRTIRSLNKKKQIH